MEVMEGAAPAKAGSASDKVRPATKRPAPDDLAKLAETYSLAALRRHYRVGHAVLVRWLTEVGIRSEGQRCVHRPMPEDFPSRAHERNAVLMEAYGCSDTLIARWRRQCGVACGTRKPARDLPHGFADVARRLTVKELMQRYGAGKGLITRWRKRVGGAAAPRPPAPRFQVAALPVLPPASRDMSIGGRAADHLRSPRGGGWVVYRCRETGEADRNGDHFLVGTRVMTEDDMLQMAERKGFRAFEDMPRATPAITSAAVSL